MKSSRIRSLILLAAVTTFGYASGAAAADAALTAAVASPARPPAAVARDKSRHPVEELTFFGISQKMNVVELWPGGGYWTDILGPYLAQGGHYTVALPQSGDEYDSGVARFRARIAAQKDRLGTYHKTTLRHAHPHLL